MSDEEAFLTILREEAEIVACDPQNVIQETGEKIMDLARRTHRYAEIACNRELSAGEEKRSEAVDKEILELGKKIGVKFEIQGDPRGFTVKLKTPKSKRYNTWGGVEVGWGVPNS